MEVHRLSDLQEPGDGVSDGLSAAETAELIGASRITARRYLEYLADTGLADRAPRYGNAGRPELEYRWR